MIRINLLPFRAARKKENVRRQVSIFFLTLTLAIIVAVSYNFILGKQITELKKKIEDTKSQLAKYNKINEEIAEIKNKLAVLNKKIDVIKSLDLNRKEPVQLLESLSGFTITDRMWLINFSTNQTSIQLSGIAVDNQTIADYMSRVENHENFESVKLLYIRPAGITDKNQDLNLKTFGLTFNKTKMSEPAEEVKKK